MVTTRAVGIRMKVAHGPDIDRLERVAEVDLSEHEGRAVRGSLRTVRPASHDIGEPGMALEAEHVLERRATHVEVGENDTPTRPGHGHCKVGRGARLAVLRRGACEHYQPRAEAKVDELEVRAEHPEGLGMRAVRLREHRQLFRGVVGCEALLPP
jgi:hypothetical protein